MMAFENYSMLTKKRKVCLRNFRQIISGKILI